MDKEGYSLNRCHLTEPRPFNPELDIHIDINSIQPPKLISIPNSNFGSTAKPPVLSKDRVWREQDFQLAVIPSSSSSLSSDISIGDIPSESLNDQLHQLGLPSFDLSKIPSHHVETYVFPLCPF